jgi:DNA-binding transcriptional MerR regulator
MENMTKISISAAAKMAGVTRQTIHRYIADGKLSQDNESKKIDVSELLRVFPDAKIDVTEVTGKRTVKNLQSVTDNDDKMLQQENNFLKEKVKMLEEQLVAGKEREHEYVKKEERYLTLIESNNRLLEAAKPKKKVGMIGRLFGKN